MSAGRDKQSHRSPPRHPVDPLAEVISDAAHSGFRTLESVTDALAESVHLQASGSSRRRRPSPAGTTPPGAVAEDLLRLFAELLGKAGEVAQDVAQAIGGQPGEEPDDEQRRTVELVELDAPAGEAATGEFTIWNTGQVVLRNVQFSTTGLTGRAGAINTEELTFRPAVIGSIVPGAGQTVTVSVSPSIERAQGVYHGVVTGEPGAGVVLLAVRSTPPR